MQKAADGSVAIIEPDIFKTTDPNYYVLYDKAEFSFNDGGLWADLTAVDFWSLPLAMHVNNNPGGIAYAGPKDATLTREKIISNLHNDFNTYTQGKNSTVIGNWEGLFLNYTSPQTASDPTENTMLRVVAPAKAMLRADKALQFPQDYLGPYIDIIWNFYKQPGNALQVDCSELVGDDVFQSQYQATHGGKAFQSTYSIFTGSVNNNGDFVFTNKNPTPDSITITKPISNSSSINDSVSSVTSNGTTIAVPFFAGTLTTTNYPPNIAPANHTIDAVIARDMCAAFDVDLLGKPNIAPLSKTYFSNANKQGLFFQDNPLYTGVRVPYDVYSRAIHNEMITYAFAYDDILGQDGTISGIGLGTLYIDIGNLSGTNIPNLHPNDGIKYNVSFVMGVTEDNEIYDANYNGTKITSNTRLTGVISPLNIGYHSAGAAQSAGYDETMSISLDPLYFDFSDYTKEIDGVIFSSVDGYNIGVIIPAPPPDYMG